jgi:integrase
MNYLKNQLREAMVRASASAPQIAEGEKIPKFSLVMRPSGKFAVYMDSTYLITTGTGDPVKAEEKRLYCELQDEARRQGIVDIRRAVVTDIIDFAIRTYPKKKKKSRRVIVCVLQKVRKHVEGLRLQDLNGDWLVQFEEAITEFHSYGWFYECIARLISAIRLYCKDNMLPAIIPFNRPPKAPGRTRVIEDFEFDLMLRLADGTEAYDKATGIWTPQESISKYEQNCRLMFGRALRLGRSFGSRPGVYNGLAWEPNPDFGHIDIANETFHRLASGESAEARKGAPAVGLPPKWLAEIQRWKAFDGDEKHVFRTMRGGPLPSQTLREIFAMFMEYLGIEGVCPHVLRHTCITRMKEKGLSASVISKICGISLDMLERRYDHSDARVVQVLGHGVMDDLLQVAA